jgi:hypothetical protein
MYIMWFIIALLIGGGGVVLWQNKRKLLKTIHWVLLGLWLAWTLFAIAVVTTLGGEPYINSGHAALVAGLSFGGIAVITGVLLFRKILTMN